MSWWWCHMAVSVSFDKICNSSRGINALFLIRKNTNSQNEVTFIWQELRRGMSQINLYDILFLRWLICWKLFYIIYQLYLIVKNKFPRFNINPILLTLGYWKWIDKICFEFLFSLWKTVETSCKTLKRKLTPDTVCTLVYVLVTIKLM